MRLFSSFSWLIVVSLLFTLPAAKADKPAVPPDYMVPYRALLTAYVHPGINDGFRGNLVDYQSWAADKNHAEAIKQLEAVSPDSFKGKAQTAFWLNAYNLLTIDLIIQHQEKESIKNIGSVLDNPWRTFTWNIGGHPMTLDAMEKALPIKTDLRLLMALSPASLSGPDLRGEPYTADRLDAQLDDQVKIFLNNDKKGLKIRGSVLEVAKIFQRFGQDFEDNGGAVGFIRRYTTALPVRCVIQGYFVENWHLNGSWGTDDVPTPPATPPVSD